ncbi:MAG: hypothetical protein AABY27_06585 [Pseudomonadota bacterium]
MKKFILFVILFFSNLSLAIEANVQDQVRSQYGSCYQSFASNLTNCTLSTCSYPDLTDTTAWRTHVVRGFDKDKCSVLYYSYIADKVIGPVEYCLYSPDQLRILAGLYNTIFNSNSIVLISEAKQRITGLNFEACKKLSDGFASNNNGN